MIGQIYMAKAGYDPAEAIEVWERMANATGGEGGPEFMSTHPSNENRKQRLSQWLSETKSLYEKAPQKHGIGETIFWIDSEKWKNFRGGSLEPAN